MANPDRKEYALYHVGFDYTLTEFGVGDKISGDIEWVKCAEKSEDDQVGFEKDNGVVYLATKCKEDLNGKYLSEA